MKRILYAIILITLCVSCQNDFENEQEVINHGFISKLDVTATIETPSSMSFTEVSETHALKPSWEVGDKIIGFGSDGIKYGFIVSEIKDGRAKLEIITSGEYAGTATEDPADGTVMNMFYAPGAVMDSIHADTKEFTVSIKQQSADVIPAIMMAQATVTNSSLSLNFTNEMSIIGIKTPKMATAERTYTDISLFGTGVNTEVKFSLSPEGKLMATPQTPGRICKSMTLTSDGNKATTGTVFIVTNPIDDSAKLTFFADNGEYLVKNNQTLVRGNYYYMTAPTFSSVPDNAIPGGFSVKDIEGVVSVVYFAKGNLQTKRNGTSTNKWGFEDFQYDYRTYYKQDRCYNGSTTKRTEQYEWGLLGWSTDASNNDGGRHTKTRATTGYTDGTFKDWGNFIDQNGTWKTLTREQWKWVIGPKDVLVHDKQARECSTLNGVKNARFIMCTVGPTTGLMLFPDVLTWPSDVPLPEASQINSHTGEYASTKYRVAQFEKLQQAGVVFLPGKSLRHGTTLSSSYDTSGLYWSATPNDTATVKGVHVDNKVFALHFMDKKGVGEGSFDNWEGLFVRLVTMAK